MASAIKSFDPKLGLHPDHKVRQPWKIPNGKIRTWPADCRCKPLNLYIAWALFDPSMNPWKKGSEAEVVVSLAGVIDVDCDKGDSSDIPLKASRRLETSPGNFQDFFVYPQPLPMIEAKPVARALHRLTHKEENTDAKGDSTTKDVSHIWRVPGTLNFPNADKIERRKAQGISTEPFLVRWVHQNGGVIDPATIIAAAPAEPERTTRETSNNSSSEGAEKLISALEALHPDVLPKVNPPATLRSFWLETGMAIHSLDWEDKGLEIFDRWSQKSRAYDRDELCDKWDTFKGGDRGVGSIYMWARGEGWTPPKEEIDMSWADAEEVTRETVNASRQQYHFNNNPGAGLGGQSAPVDGPLPLFSEMGPSAPFPIDALGDIMGPAAQAIANMSQIAPAVAAQSILATASLIAANYADIKAPWPGGGAVPLSLFHWTFASSSDRKSSADKLAMRPVREYEKDLKADFAEDMKVYSRDLAAWQGQRKSIMGMKIPDGGDRAAMDERRRRLDEIGPEPEHPLHPRLTTTEPTMEALTVNWKHLHASLGIFSDEGASFIGGYSMSLDKRGQTLGKLCDAWSAKFDRGLRVNEEYIDLDGRRLSMHLMLQPALGMELLGDKTLLDQGFLSRMLIVYPGSIDAKPFRARHLGLFN